MTEESICREYREDKKYGILFLTLLLGLASGGCGNKLSGPEKTAVRFYKEVWVEGDLNHSSRLLDRQHNRKELGWRVEQPRAPKGKIHPYSWSRSLHPIPKS